VLLEFGLWDFVERVIQELIEPILLVDHKKKMLKTKQVILESVKDHFIPHIIEKTMGKKMFDALVTISE